MEMYILKSAACLALFFTFYKLFLENTSIHNFKRFYLFGSLLASFLIPLITFTTYVETSAFIAAYTEGTPQLIFSETEQAINYWHYVLWTVYGLGVLFFSLKFFRNLFGLIQQIRKNPKYRNNSFINVLLKETVIPHTFLNYIFLNKAQFENHEIPAEVMLHEEAHARQKHSLDVIFVEILQILFWFNPLLYFLKRSVKLNHEFLADRAVLKAGVETSVYQKILLAFSSNAVTPSLAHSINYSSIKKRFTVMKTHTSKRAIWLRSLLLLPLLSVLIYGFSTKEVVKKEIQSEIVQQKATEAELAEYNKLAKKYNAVDIEKRIIKKNDLERLEIIYKKMTDAQKSNAEPFPECIPPPPPAPKVKKGKESDIPPPPLPAPKVPSAENGNLYTPA
ncbi:M56 family metallopeptidase [Aequorivita sp. CIP111184]|uniref:M56 family metallopeptidase n=1 Tax=Aequorivita sp. CIP111184 TaxID=2211356 RepID=UPI000DBC1EDE|nr:M56 family metallopeptidase [Aequorivita sp. CIP111184]SRX53850.1 Regulatory protein BlaR1 [Aequorivita sp. CIP111184]